jgi:hypothetical protein
MEKFTGKTLEEYEVYAKKRRNKSIICRTYDKAFIEYKQKHKTKLLTLFLCCVKINTVKEVNKVMEE